MQEFRTVQEAMDYAVSKIVGQGGQCVRAEGRRCAYGDGRGRHCVIGWLMVEKTPEAMSYHKGVKDMARLHGRWLPRVVVGAKSAFASLQSFHDLSCRLNRADMMQGLEKRHGIDTSSPHWQQWVDMGT